MTEPEQSPEFDIKARDQSRVNAFGHFQANTVNFGDSVEAQRSVLVVDIDPIPPTRDAKTWIDRTAVQAELKGWIESDQTRVVELVAAGGFGKSLLAVWLYDQCQSQQFQIEFDDALWINFRKVPSFNAFGRWVQPEIGFVIDPSIAARMSNDDLRRQTIYRLCQKRCLVVMDQLETLVDSPERSQFESFLHQWQQQGRRSVVVITSRERYLDSDEFCVALTGFTSQEGTAFLENRGISAEPDDAHANLEQLSRLADGHPLLLNLAASWLLETAGGRLKQTGLSFFEGLFRSSVGNPEAKVGEVFRELLGQLSEMVQTALLEVSVYQNAFDLERIQAMQPDLTEDEVQRLAARGFLLQQGERWTLHPLVQTFVERTAEARGVVAGAHQKAIDFFTARFEAGTHYIDEYLASFHHHCELGRYEAAYEVIVPAYRWLDLQGWYHTLVEVYSRLQTAWIDSPSIQSEQSKWRCSITRLGVAYRNLGEYRRAIELHEQALSIKQDIGDRNRAKQLTALGIIYRTHLKSLEIDVTMIGDVKPMENELLKQSD